MRIKSIAILCFILLMMASCTSKKHLFILSGQSNIARLDPNVSFTPKVEEKFGKENVIVVKSAKGGQPIRRWYKDWKPLVGNQPKAQADLYKTLITKVREAIKDEKLASVTFIWMQGERDAKEMHGEVYERSLIGLYNQLKADVGHRDINFVIGRISDYDMENKTYPHWTFIRKIQEKVANSNPRFSWINTDDLNDGVNQKGQQITNDLHMSVNGYVIMGERFAEKAVELIRKK